MGMWSWRRRGFGRGRRNVVWFFFWCSVVFGFCVGEERGGDGSRAFYTQSILMLPHGSLCLCALKLFGTL